MRLYQLMKRVGLKKSGLFPWFSPPAAGAPVRYYGWVWDPARRTWIPDDVPRVSITVKPVRYPKPLYPPGPAVPSKVEGWKWSKGKKGWLPLPMPLETVAIGEPRPPKPLLPAAHPGVGEVLGWVFDFQDMVWNEAPMPVKLVEREKERPPAPKYPPRSAVPEKVPGWYWDDATLQWLEVILAEAVVGYQPQIPLPPGISMSDVEAAAAFDPSIQLALETLSHPWIPPILLTEYETRTFLRLLTESGYSVAGAREMMVKYAEVTKGMKAEEVVKVWQKVAETVIHNWKLVHAVSPNQGQNISVDNFRRSMGVSLQGPLRTFVIFALMYMTAMVGWAIGTILEKILLSHEELLVLKPDIQTFLLGPDLWYYGRHVGVSATGLRYYSCCDGIGTTYVRHMRATAYGGVDILDFPGGFLEEGWHRGMFVKYVWKEWHIKYVGFLIRINDGLFQLKRAPLPPGAPPFMVWTEAEHWWCPEFRTYL